MLHSWRNFGRNWFWISSRNFSVVLCDWNWIGFSFYAATLGGSLKFPKKLFSGSLWLKPYFSIGSQNQGWISVSVSESYILDLISMLQLLEELWNSPRNYSGVVCDWNHISVSGTDNKVRYRYWSHQIWIWIQCYNSLQNFGGNWLSEVVFDQNQVSVLRAKSRVEYRYWYWSHQFWI